MSTAQLVSVKTVTVKGICDDLRKQLTPIADATKELAALCKTVPQHTAMSEPHPDTGEMIANTMLAYRHLEDARMRLGKVIQAFDGGISVYEPKKP